MAGSLQDQMMAYFTAMVDGTITLAGGSPATVPTVQQSNSLSNATTVTTPTAAQVLATVTAAQAGTYQVEVTSAIGGTTVASLEANNIQLRVNGVAIGKVVNPIPGTAGCTGVGIKRARVVAAAGNVIDVIAVALATTGAIYSVDLVATRIA